MFLLAAVSRFFTGASMTAAWVGLMWLGYEMTGTPSGAGLVLMLSSIPAIAANIPAGALADRVSKRDLLFFARVSASVLLLLFVAAHRSNSRELFYGLVLALGIGDGLFLLCAGMVAASSAHLLLLPRRERKRDGGKPSGVPEPGGRKHPAALPPARRRFARGFGEGLVYFGNCPTCRFLLLFFALFFGVYCLTSGLAMPYCEELLGGKGGMRGSVIYSIMDAAAALSGFFGAFFIPRLLKRFGQVGSLFLGAGLSAVELLVMGFVPDAFVVVGVLSVTGISASFLTVPMLTLVQRNVEPSHTGRVLNGIDAAGSAAALLSCGIGVLLAERFGILRMFRFSGFVHVARASFFLES